MILTVPLVLVCLKVEKNISVRFETMIRSQKHGMAGRLSEHFDNLYLCHDSAF